DEYSRHARKFGDPQTVYETAYGDGLTLDKLLVLGHILVKLDPERGYRHKGKWEAFTWRWAQGFHARRDRYQLDANGDEDVLRMTEWEEALLFGGGGTFNTASPNSPNAALAPPQSRPLGASPYAL